MNCARAGPAGIGRGLDFIAVPDEGFGIGRGDDFIADIPGFFFWDFIAGLLARPTQQ
jgi:hypothetical protein